MNFKASTQGRSGNWKAVIEHEPWSNSVRVWLAELVHDKTFVANIKDGVIEMTEIKEGQTPEKPLLVINGQAWEAISEALSDALPPIKKEIVDAELKATKYHLEDMRKLALIDK